MPRITAIETAIPRGIMSSPLLVRRRSPVPPSGALMPRVRQRWHRSEAVDVDHGQLVGRHLNRFAVVMDLHELAPGGRRARCGKDSPAA